MAATSGTCGEDQTEAPGKGAKNRLNPTAGAQYGRLAADLQGLSRDCLGYRLSSLISLPQRTTLLRINLITASGVHSCASKPAACRLIVSILSARAPLLACAHGNSAWRNPRGQGFDGVVRDEPAVGWCRGAHRLATCGDAGRRGFFALVDPFQQGFEQGRVHRIAPVTVLI